MKFLIFIIFLICSNIAYAGCDDQPANDVDWTNCNFSDELDLIGVSLANAKMTGINLYYVNLQNNQ